MTRKELEKTEWANRILNRCSLLLYNKVLDLVSSNNSVEISNNYGDFRWVIIKKDCNDLFILESFDRFEYAIEFCNRMGWNYAE